MKAVLLAVFITSALAACASSAPRTAWGKPGISMVDYRIDAGQCAILAASSEPMESPTHVAGGIHGQNALPKDERSKAVTNSNSPDQSASPGRAHTMGDSAYRESANADFATRAATQQRTQEILAQRERVLRLQQCLTGRGYTEFPLTPEEREHLRQLPEGSEARREYLYKLGTNPEVLNRLGGATPPN
jgi:hypothetical protein